MAERDSMSMKRGIVVVVANDCQEDITARVETRKTPFDAMSAAIAASISKPCSMASTPANTPTLVPWRSVAWAVTFAPAECTASTTEATSSTVHGAVSLSGPSR